MKKQTFIFIFVAMVCHGNAQSVLYKYFLHRDGIRTSYVKNYPIGDLTVGVTMLEAVSIESFNLLNQELCAIANSRVGMKKRSPDSTRFRQTLKANPDDNFTWRFPDTNMALPFFATLRVNDLKITRIDSVSKGDSPIGFRFKQCEPLRGDKGEYLIFSSSADLTTIVFHSANQSQSVTILRTLINQIIGKYKISEKYQ